MLAVIMRLIRCRKEVHTNLFQSYCLDLYLFLLDNFCTPENNSTSWIRISPSLHKVLVHSWELIKNNNGFGLGSLDEEGLEANNKILRSSRINLVRKTSQLANLTDVLNRMWLSSDPGICSARSNIKSACKLCYNLGHKKWVSWIFRLKTFQF